MSDILKRSGRYQRTDQGECALVRSHQPKPLDHPGLLCWLVTNTYITLRQDWSSILFFKCFDHKKNVSPGTPVIGTYYYIIIKCQKLTKYFSQVTYLPLTNNSCFYQREGNKMKIQWWRLNNGIQMWQATMATTEKNPFYCSPHLIRLLPPLLSGQITDALRQ
jgi:hypothetical protein